MAECVIWTIHVSDVVAWCTQYTGPRFHAVLTDPPYGLEFMGKEWDKLGAGVEETRDSAGGFLRDGKSGSNPYAAARIRYGEQVNKVQEWHRRWAAGIQELCLPGAMMLSFGGTRTYHRLTCGIEDAGWEIRDCLCWLYGSGFPKSHDISKAIDKAAGAEREVMGPNRYAGRRVEGSGPDNGDACYGQYGIPGDETVPSTPAAQEWNGWGTALKPAWEPIILAMKPRDGTFAHNAIEHGVAGLWIDGTRIPISGETIEVGRGSRPARETGIYGRYEGQGERQFQSQGRWPANLILNEEAGMMLDEQSGTVRSSGNYIGHSKNNNSNWFGENAHSVGTAYSDTGGASRFFYCAKASPTERNAGLHAVEELQRDLSRRPDQPSMHGGEGNPYNRGAKPIRNNHPTVKPIALAKYLATLLLPPPSSAPRRILIPFSGSGSEAIGALLAGWEEIVLIDLDPHYCEIAEARLRFWQPWAGSRLDPSDILSSAQAQHRRKQVEAKADQLTFLEDS